MKITFKLQRERQCFYQVITDIPFVFLRALRVLAGHPYPLRLVSGRQRGDFKSPWLHGQGQNVQPVVASLLSSVILCPVFLFDPHSRPLASLATPRALEPVQLYRPTQAAESRGVFKNKLFEKPAEK